MWHFYDFYIAIFTLRIPVDMDDLWWWSQCVTWSWPKSRWITRKDSTRLIMVFIFAGIIWTLFRGFYWRKLQVLAPPSRRNQYGLSENNRHSTLHHWHFARIYHQIPDCCRSTLSAGRHPEIPQYWNKRIGHHQFLWCPLSEVGDGGGWARSNDRLFEQEVVWIEGVREHWTSPWWWLGIPLAEEGKW